MERKTVREGKLYGKEKEKKNEMTKEIFFFFFFFSNHIFSCDSINMFAVRRSFSTVKKIKVANPIVDLDGDEMVCLIIFFHLFQPFFLFLFLFFFGGV
jgi:hypothetical protein